MHVRTLSFLAVALSAGLLTAADYKLDKVAMPPKELAQDVAAVLDPQGHQVVGPKGLLVEVWLAKEVELKPGFQPTFMTKYPFTVGQLIGAMRVAKDAKYTDYKGQDVPAGVYTLRYGVQPSDGNHLGTSPTSDYLLAIPAETDTDPGLIRFTKQLTEKSAKTVGMNHPAVFWLPPPEDAPADTKLVHDEDRELWILNVPVNGDEKKVPLQLVLIGQSEA